MLMHAFPIWRKVNQMHSRCSTAWTSCPRTTIPLAPLSVLLPHVLVSIAYLLLGLVSDLIWFGSLALWFLLSGLRLSGF